MSEKKEINLTDESAPKRRLPIVAPPVDIYEGSEELVVVADVPGAVADDLTLKFEEQRLDIEAIVNREADDGKASIAEFSSVDYRRSFEVTTGIDVENITAELSGGVLTIRLPKSESNKPRSIPVRVN